MNNQPTETRTYGELLSVHSVFYTIQGEGPYSGWPAVFVRLAGCNLQCRGCDTEYTEGRQNRSVKQIVEEILPSFPQLTLANPRRRLVVITGGEPFRQAVGPLCSRLLKIGFRVQIETNGTIAPMEDFPVGATIVCSPKAPSIAEGLKPYISAYKYVIESDYILEKDGLPTRVLGGTEVLPARPHGRLPVYVTPFDSTDPSRNLLHLQAAVKVTLDFNYILQIQLHKLVHLP